MDAKQANPEAQNKLGEVYFLGMGLPQNYLDAHMWFNLSGSQGNKNAIYNRNMAERKMSAEQIVKAQQMARDWKSSKAKSILRSKSILEEFKENVGIK